MIRVAILTVSDAASSGTREDVSGPRLAERCRSLGWEVAATACVPDEIPLISKQILDWVDGRGIDLVLTTGGTGISMRDNTPEATRAMLERELPGIGELMRARGLEQTPFSVLSRALAGTRNRSLIVNLPGAPRGALQSLAVLEPLASHVLKLLQGYTEHGS